MAYKVNNEIESKEVRIILEGENLGVFTKNQALNKADEQGLDLIEISPKAEPPVCKIQDFGKFKYKEDKKRKEAQKRNKEKKSETKELQLRAVTDENDLNIKAKRGNKFLEDGDKVKVSMRLKGRENIHKNDAKEILHNFINKLNGEKDNIEDKGKILSVLINPKK